MKHTTLLTFPLILLLFCQVANAQNPKREMRATWLTTVANIDWPTSSTADAQKRELTRMLDSIQTMNMNTVLFQVRPCADAFYRSAYEPWSSYLKVNRGTDPGYDPLQFCLDECHKRGLACHAWMNPYRYSSRTGAAWTGANDTPLNYDHTHPDWLLYYKSNIVLDPGNPAVVQRIKEVVGDLLSKYEVDGILFDDYFYPYGGTTNQDTTSQRLYKPAGMNVDDWRRSNVNAMVAAVYDTIQAVKPWVTFGISPFGIWTTSYSVAQKEGINLPNNVTGGNMYQEIYCDPVAWLKEGTIDYVSPQLYWKTGGAQDYRTLSKWWGGLADRFGKHFYSSMAIYKYSEKSDAAYTVAELESQTISNRAAVTDNAPGAVFYNTKAWVYDKSLRKAFLQNEFKHVALQPAINWKPAADRTMVTNLALTGNKLTWQHADGDVHFAVYAIPSQFRNRVGVFSKGDALLAVVYGHEYELPAQVVTGGYAIGVSVLDGYNNEFSLRLLGEEEQSAVATTLLAPHAGGIRKLPITFTWTMVPQADSYVIQIARDAQFEDIVLAHETTETSFATDLRQHFKYQPLGTYYWRVRTRKPNANDVWTAGQPFRVDTYNGVEDVEDQTSGQGPKVESRGIYSVYGQYLGDKIDNLPKGIYIINGQKVIL